MMEVARIGFSSISTNKRKAQLQVFEILVWFVALLRPSISRVLEKVEHNHLPIRLKLQQ
jgi:hypothetical protein